ncbi:hypothetical protein OG302_43030 [Streptomyces sp. NBC_01283]|uniref:hypothetical protein n=1 Tax=Streptomyces sp. NBC_01283 TaxID=2903812 RepID=UPI00352C2CE1|nr:hypothetical protein OG302_43030 [Streptomyces sp. NBC_01283]
MTITAQWVRQQFSNGTFTLTGALLGLGDSTDYLFSDACLGSSWTVEIDHHNDDALVAWGAASVKAATHSVEVQFLEASPDASGDTPITGIAVYVDLDEDWRSTLFPNLNVDTLEPFGFTNPEAALIVDPDQADDFPYIEGAARYGPLVEASQIPRRFCVRQSSPGYLDLYSRLNVQQSYTDFNGLMQSLPFVGLLPSVEIPSGIESIIGGLNLNLSYARVTLQEDGGLPVGGSISIEIGDLNHEVTIIQGLFTATAVDLSLDLMGIEFLIGAKYTGKIGQTDATVSGVYAKDGQMRLLGGVKSVTLDSTVHEWLNSAVGADIAQILSGTTIESMTVEINMSPSEAAVLSAGLEVAIPIPGDQGDAYLSLKAIKQGQDTAAIAGALEFPMPTDENPGQSIIFQGSVSKASDDLTFSLAWEADDTFEMRIADLFHLLGVGENIDVPFGDIGLSSLACLYLPKAQLLAFGVNLPPLQIVFARLGTT